VKLCSAISTVICVREITTWFQYRDRRGSVICLHGLPSDNMAAPSNIDEEKRLANAYSLATAHYTWAVAELSRKLGIVPQPEYEKLKRIVEEARNEVEELRSTLQKVVNRDAERTRRR
jgi:hypothetical protein